MTRFAVVFDETRRPETTGVYCLKALQQLAATRRIDDVEHLRPDDLASLTRSDCRWDVLIAIDDGLDYELPTTTIPTAWWAIDTHLDFDRALRRARQCRWTFAAQRNGTERLREHGIDAVWLPLACDPDLHGRQAVATQFDVSFVGNVNSTERHHLLSEIRQRFPNSFVGNRYFQEMAAIYSASKIVFNRSLIDDINMRVFEGLCSGSLLVTNSLPENGLFELFQDGTHLVTYDTEQDLFQKLNDYLHDDMARQRIADAGQEEVLAKHTYRHRMETLVDLIESQDTTTFLLEEGWIDQVDFGIKTFLRPRALHRLLSSILEYYPRARVTIVDDGGIDTADDSDSQACRALITRHRQFRLVTMPFDSGVSAGRNILVAETDRPYLLLLDDDFCFTAETRIETLVQRLQADRSIDLAAGVCFDWHGDQRQRRRSGGILERLGPTLVHTTSGWRDQATGRCDYFPDFALFRREVFDHVAWRGGVGGEHYDFCLQVQESRLGVVQVESVSIDHYPETESLPGYVERRFNFVAAQQEFLVRWKLGSIVQDGVTILQREGSIGRETDLPQSSPRTRRDAMADRGRLVTNHELPQKSNPYFEHAREDVQELVPTSARRILDLGCGAGRLSAALKARQPAHVTGVEFNPDAAAIARTRLDEVRVAHLERDSLDFAEGRFDCVICADILEHLRQPEALLARIRRWLRPTGTLMISLPNVRNYTVIRSLLAGNWTYESAGLLDTDHVRFFTRRELEKLLFRSGFDIDDLRMVPGEGFAEWVSQGRPLEIVQGGFQVRAASTEEASEFFAYQYLVRAVPQVARHRSEDLRQASPPKADEPTDSSTLPTSPGATADRFGSAVSSSSNNQKTLATKTRPVPPNSERQPIGLNSLAERYPWPTSRPVVPMHSNHQGWFADGAREVLTRTVTPDMRLIVELGSWLGLSTRFLADQAPQAKVIAVDHWQGSVEHHNRSEWQTLLPQLYESFLERTWDYRDRIQPLRFSTLDGLQLISEAGLKPDLIFVDADHSYAAVKADVQTCRRLFPQAILTGDDYDDPGVQQAVQEIADHDGLLLESFGQNWRGWRLTAPVPSRPRLVRNCAPDAFGLTSIVIVTWNQLPYTQMCLDSLRLRTDEAYELIVVDNGSTDGTVEYLRSQPDITLIENTENRGFPAAVNQGLRVASGEQLLLLNNDTILTTGWLRRMLETLDSDPQIGMVGPTTNCAGSEQQIDIVGYSHLNELDGFAWSLHRRLTSDGIPLIHDTDRLIGFCLLFKREVFESIGLLDERFGIGCFEDDDFCRRAHEVGYRTVIARHSFIHHYGSATFRGSGTDLGQVLQCNEQLYHQKWSSSGGTNVALAVPRQDSRIAEHPTSSSSDSEQQFSSSQLGLPVGARQGYNEDLGCSSGTTADRFGSAVSSSSSNQKTLATKTLPVPPGGHDLQHVALPVPRQDSRTTKQPTSSSSDSEQQFSSSQFGLPVGARQGDLEAKPRPEFMLNVDDDNNLIIVPNTVRLSGCLIVRNNEHTIRPCLESLKPWVDEMIVVDTGSTDATPQIAEELGARVYHWQWRDDFAAARNQSLDHARGEWIFWMDSDDTLPEECGRKLRELVDSLFVGASESRLAGFHAAHIPADQGSACPEVGVHDLSCLDSSPTPHCNPAGVSGPDTATMGYVMQVHCPGDDPHDVTVVDHVKLFRNLPELRFEFRIHEQILPAIRRANGEVAFTDIYVVHSGSDRTPHGQAGKLERDFKLLNLELADRPDHPFVLFNLGMTHADCRQFDEAIHFLVRCIEVSGPEESHVRKAYALLISSLMQSGQYERADSACRDGRAIFPDDKELLFRQAMLQHQQGRLADAILTYRKVLSVDGDRHFTSIDAGLSSFKARHNLALVYEDAGDYARAVDEWRRITETETHYVQGWQGLIEALLKAGDTRQVDQVCRRLRQESTPALRSIAAYGQGRVSELQGDMGTALNAFAEAERLDSTDTHALRQSCRILFESGRWDEVERHLERLIEKADEDASAFHNLAIARWQTGHYEPALAAFRQSLKLRPDSLATWQQLGLRLTECGQHSEAAHCHDQVERLSRSMTQPTEVLTEA